MRFTRFLLPVWFLLTTIFLSCSASGATVKGDLRGVGNGAINLQVNIQRLGTNMLSQGGSNVVVGPAINIIPTNGIFQTNLVSARFKITIGTYSAIIAVPGTDTTNWFNDLVQSGTETFSYTNANSTFKVAVTANDTTPGFLSEKIAVSGGTLGTNNPSGNEKLLITVTGGGGGGETNRVAAGSNVTVVTNTTLGVTVYTVSATISGGTVSFTDVTNVVNAMIILSNLVSQSQLNTGLNLVSNSTKAWSTNLVFVDSLRGSDSTGKRGDANKPFLTLGVAQTNAIAGDWIWLKAGNYASTRATNIMVDYWLEESAVISPNFSGPSNINFYGRGTVTNTTLNSGVTLNAEVFNWVGGTWVNTNIAATAAACTLTVHGVDGYLSDTNNAGGFAGWGGTNGTLCKMSFDRSLIIHDIQLPGGAPVFDLYAPTLFGVIDSFRPAPGSIIRGNTLTNSLGSLEIDVNPQNGFVTLDVGYVQGAAMFIAPSVIAKWVTFENAPIGSSTNNLYGTWRVAVLDGNGVPTNDFFFRGEIDSARLAGSNYLTAPMVGPSGSNFISSVRLAGSNYLTEAMVGPSGSNFISSVRLTGSNYLTALLAASQFGPAGSNFVNQPTLNAASNFLYSQISAGGATLTDVSNIFANLSDSGKSNFISSIRLAGSNYVSRAELTLSNFVFGLNGSAVNLSTSGTNVDSGLTTNSVALFTATAGGGIFDGSLNERRTTISTNTSIWFTNLSMGRTYFGTFTNNGANVVTWFHNAGAFYKFLTPTNLPANQETIVSVKLGPGGAQITVGDTNAYVTQIALNASNLMSRIGPTTNFFGFYSITKSTDNDNILMIDTNRNTGIGWAQSGVGQWTEYWWTNGNYIHIRDIGRTTVTHILRETFNGITLSTVSTVRPAIFNSAGDLTNASGTADSTTYLRGDGVLATLPGVPASAITNNLASSYTFTNNGPYMPVSQSTSTNIDWQKGDWFTNTIVPGVTALANLFSNVTVNRQITVATINLTNDATMGWPATVIWYGNPVLVAGSNTTTFVSFNTMDGKTNGMLIAGGRAPMVRTNDFVLGTRYTNTVAGGFTGTRGMAGASVSLTAAVAGTASVSLYVEQGTPNVTNRFRISAGPLASLVTIQELVAPRINPSAIFYFTDETSGTGASSAISAGTSVFYGD